MNAKYKAISLVVSLLFLTTGLSGCSEKAAEPVANKAKPTQSTPSAPAPAPAPAAAPAPAPKPAATASLSGKAVYDSSCMACHAMAIAGAPKFADKAAWAPRIAKGMETLYASSINGMQGDAGIMPPKGGRLDLSDAEIKAAVDYMVEAAR